MTESSNPTDRQQPPLETNETPPSFSETEAFSDIPPPEDFLPSPRKAVGPFRRWPPLFPAFGVPLALAVVSFVVSVIHWNTDGDHFSASGYEVWTNGNSWRLFTALFDHADVAHWGLNMMPFLFFGWLLCSYFGTWLFVLGALFVGLTSNALAVALYPPHTSLIGASGVVYGIIAMWLVLYVRFDDENNLAKKSMRVVGFILMLLFPTAYEHTTSYLAHASGFVFGIIAGIALLPLVKLNIFPEAAPPKNIFVRKAFRIRRTRHENPAQVPLKRVNPDDPVDFT